MRELIFLKPVLKEMIWGGSRLGSDFGYDIPSDHTGECWAISAHPNGNGVIKGGTYDGHTLSWLWDQHRELFGNVPGDRFPLLVKIIDAREDLSIQVHPNDAYAREHENGSLGKTECWYILDCDEGTKIVIGHHAKNWEEMRAMILEKRWKEFIREVDLHPGDFFQINPGCLHAIKGGTLILETQQNSDITYRVYDYDRLSGGKPRQLHVQQSIDVITAPFETAKTAPKKWKKEDAVVTHLISCPYYSVEKMDVDGTVSCQWTQPFVNVSIVEGSGSVDGIPVKKGDHFIIPSGYGEMKIEGTLSLIDSWVETGKED